MIQTGPKPSTFDIRALASRVRERLNEKGVTERAASLAINNSTDTIRNIMRRAEKGEPYHPRADTLQGMARFFGVSVQWLMYGEDEPSQPRSGYSPLPEILGARDLPVFSAVEGGPGEMVVSTDPIEWVARPWFLREVKEGYAVVVTGDSMSPVYEPGDIVIVNPRLPAIPNKNAIFVGGEERGEFVATVKRLIRVTTTHWHVRQYNPPEGKDKDFTLAKQEWPKALRVVGKYEG